MTEFSILPATDAADMAAVKTLCWDYRRFLHGHSPEDRNLTETFYPDDKYRKVLGELPRLHARPTGIILLARDRRAEPAGCGMTQPLFPGTAEIKRVFVIPAARGQGLAATLCKALVEQASADGYDRVVLDTSRNLTAAGRLYERLGFTETGPYQPLPADVIPLMRFFEKRLR